MRPRRSGRKARILVTGFDAFGREKTNPSALIVERLRDDEIQGADLTRAILRTSYRKSERAIRELLRLVRPDAVLCLGLASRSARLSLEVLAVNADHAEAADNSGEGRLRRVIDLHGPRVLESRLPLERIRRALARARVPAEFSYHAGTYVCNHVFYVLMRALRNRPRVPAGFVHLPPARSLVRKGLALKRILEGVRIILRVTASAIR